MGKIIAQFRNRFRMAWEVFKDPLLVSEVKSLRSISKELWWRDEFAIIQCDDTLYADRLTFKIKMLPYQDQCAIKNYFGGSI